MSSAKKNIPFKPYIQNQLHLLPPSLDQLIAENHPVRVVNDVIEKLDIDSLLKSYKGGGTTSYHPRMLLKVLVYSYLSNIYSSRKMEQGLKENIHLMWLSGMSQPDHNTINRFRTERLKGVIKKVFSEIVLLLVGSGHISLKEAYTDGTKIEANANKYTFIWGNAIKTSKERIVKQLEELWAHGQKVAHEELKDTTPITFEEISAEKVKATVDQIQQAIADKPVDKKVKQKLKYASKHWPENLEKYQQQSELLEGRNSASKTDPQATFMRMKEDHMKNGQLKPGYNLQLSTNNQYITCYSLHQCSTDYPAFIPHFEEFETLYGMLPDTVTADAGYGSEQNYQYLHNKGIEGYVKYNYFEQEQKGKRKAAAFHHSSLYYNKEKNTFTCPMGQTMNFIGERKRTTDNGFIQTYQKYQAQNCNNCPLRSSCHTQKGNRIIEVNHTLEQYKEIARANLLSEKGIAHRKQRVKDTEPVFANIKQNKNFRRFNLRGLLKVEIEAGLIAIAHNLKKMAA